LSSPSTVCTVFVLLLPKLSRALSIFCPTFSHQFHHHNQHTFPSLTRPLSCIFLYC
jgi:hypothetical protein